MLDLPAGGAALGVGFEARTDEIKSKPDAVAADGLFWGFFADKGAYGARDVTEWFAELEIPLLVNKPLFTELNLNISARFTDDKYYGNNTTEAIKLGWRPNESLLIRGTWGTAFKELQTYGSFFVRLHWIPERFRSLLFTRGSTQ